MRNITMNRILRAIPIVCIVEIATESRAELNILGGSLRHWQSMPEVDTEYKEGANLGGKLAKYSMNGIEMALEAACELLHRRDARCNIASIRRFVENKNECEGHSKYNDGTPETQNFVVMVVMLAGMITPHDVVKARCKKYLEEGAARLAARLANEEEGEAPWWQIPGIGDAKHNPIADCELYIEGFKLDEYLKDVGGTIRCMSGNARLSELDCDGTEIDVGPGFSNFATAYQVMARLPGLSAAMTSALEDLNKLVAENEVKQDGDAEAAHAKYTAHRAAIWSSLIAMTELAHRYRVRSKLIERMMQDAIDGEVITAKERPESVVEKIMRIVEQYAPDRHVLRNLFAQERVVKNERLARVKRAPKRIQIPKGEESQVTDVALSTDCQSGMLKLINEIKIGEADTRLPLMFGSYPMVLVKNGALGRCRNITDLTFTMTIIAEVEIFAAMRNLFNRGHALHLFEWNGNGWSWHTNKPPVGVTKRTIYEFTSAIIRTRWDDVDEYLFVRRMSYESIFAAGERWIGAFGNALKNGLSPDLGEVCALFYEPHDPFSHESDQDDEPLD
jgi:hypothetical protein